MGKLYSWQQVLGESSTIDIAVYQFICLSTIMWYLTATCCFWPSIHLLNAYTHSVVLCVCI